MLSAGWNERIPASNLNHDSRPGPSSNKSPAAPARYASFAGARAPDRRMRIRAMTSPSVSVVTPSFNQADFLEETILSVIGQDYTPIEYLIVDGGSTDGSVGIIRAHESKLAYWVSERDSGQAEAINKGWAKSSGDILSYLNSDDVYLPGTVKAAAELFASRPEIDVAYGDRIVIDERGRTKEIVPSPEFSLDSQIAVSLPQECVFLRRRALDSVGSLNPKFNYLMDYDLWLRMLRKGMTFHHVGRPWAKYRVHRKAKSSAQRVGFWRELIVVVEAYLSSDPRVPAVLARSTKSRLYFQAGLEIACGGAEKDGAEYVRRSFEFGVLPFGETSVLEAQAANIIVNALLLADHVQSPGAMFDWLLPLIPPQHPLLFEGIKKIRQDAIADYYLAKAFDEYENGNFSRVGRFVLAGVRNRPAALKNRGVWSIAAKSLVSKSADR